jgi:hypothetical protein
MCFETIFPKFSQNAYPCTLQVFHSKSKQGQRSTTYNCPLSYKAGCHACFSVREFPDCTELWSSGKYDRMSHISDRSAGLTNQQRLGIQQSVRACPLQVGSVVLDRSKKFSLLKRIPVTDKNVSATSRMVWQRSDGLFFWVISLIGY